MGLVKLAREGWTGALGRRSNPAVCTSPDPFVAPRGAGTPLLNPPVVTPVPFAAPRGAAAAFPNPPVVTAAAAWLVRAPFVRSKRPVSRGRGITGLSTGRSNAGAAAGTSGRGGAGRCGAATGADGDFTSSVAGKMNALIDCVRGVDGFSDARIGTTIRTIAKMACNTTLSHRPAVERAGGRVLNRVSSNRTDMCSTELKCVVQN
jgi:hypothetical protein